MSCCVSLMHTKAFTVIVISLSPYMKLEIVRSTAVCDLVIIMSRNLPYPLKQCDSFDWPSEDPEVQPGFQPGFNIPSALPSGWSDNLPTFHGGNQPDISFPSSINFPVDPFSYPPTIDAFPYPIDIRPHAPGPNVFPEQTFHTPPRLPDLAPKRPTHGKSDDFQN